MAQKKRVTFRLIAPGAKEVMLVGDFNRWSRTANPMEAEPNGRWHTTLLLAPGRYEFKFLVDGKWRAAAKNEKTVRNRFGTWNNLVVIH